MSQPSLDAALQNVNLKLTMGSINRKSNFLLNFLQHYSTISVYHWISMRQCTVILFLKHTHCHALCQQYFRDKMILSNIRESNTSSSQMKEPQKLLKTHVWGNPYKVTVLWQDLGKSQKHRWSHFSRMHCNVCLLVELQLVKVF